MNSNRYAILLLLPLLGACSALDIVGARLSAGIVNMHAVARVETSQGTASSAATDPIPSVRLELTNQVEPNVEVGLILGAGRGSIHDVSIDTYEVGGSFRQFLGSGRLRPYGELAAGYRRFNVEDDAFGQGGADLLFGSAAIGLDLRLGRGVSLFAQGGWDVGLGDGFTTDGPMGYFGLSVSF